MVGGINFDAMNATMTFQGQSISQIYYATKHRGHIIMIVETFPGETTDTILEAVSFSLQ